MAKATSSSCRRRALPQPPVCATVVLGVGLALRRPAEFGLIAIEGRRTAPALPGEPERIEWGGRVGPLVPLTQGEYVYTVRRCHFASSFCAIFLSMIRLILGSGAFDRRTGHFDNGADKDRTCDARITESPNRVDRR